MSNHTSFREALQPGMCVARRYYQVGERVIQIGRSSCFVRCPFCQGLTRVFMWSLAGGGKRCGCGALFGTRGVAHKRKDLLTHDEALQENVSC